MPNFLQASRKVRPALEQIEAVAMPSANNLILGRSQALGIISWEHSTAGAVCNGRLPGNKPRSALTLWISGAEAG